MFESFCVVQASKAFSKETWPLLSFQPEGDVVSFCLNLTSIPSSSHPFSRLSFSQHVSLYYSSEPNCLGRRSRRASLGFSTHYHPTTTNLIITMDAFYRRREARASRNSQGAGTRAAGSHDDDIELANTNSTQTRKRSTKVLSDDADVNHNGHKITKHIAPEGESGRRGFHPWAFLRICFRSASPASAMVNVLWPVVPGV